MPPEPIELPPSGQDIYLDFLNRDSRQYFGIYQTRPAAWERELLEGALNIAVFLTRDACYCPPGFLLEDPTVQELISSKVSFRAARIVLLPVRESLDDLWQKKEREYATVREQYLGLFDLQGQRFVEENQGLLVDRPFEVGKLLVARWEEAPDLADTWAGRFIREFPPGVVELFRRIPRRLQESGQAITWATISNQLEDIAKKHRRYRQLVQHIYFGIYTDLMGLEILRNIPGFRSDFGLGSHELFYDYQALQDVADVGHVWDRLLRLEEDQLLYLRRTKSYFEFRRIYKRLCDLCSTRYLLREALALPLKERSSILARTADVERFESLALTLFRLPHETESALQALGERLAIIVGRAVEEKESQLDKREKRREMMRAETGVAEDIRSRQGGVDRPPVIAIYAPLSEERQVLVERLGLTPDASKPYRWHGELESGCKVLLYSANLMGRVPAAIATAQLLAGEELVDAILVAGFAGGFAESETSLGDVIVPRVVADLALRKATSTEEANNRIRPEPYEVSRALQGFLETQFDRTGWTIEVIREAEWPEGRRPRFKFGGTLVCGDEVVASDTHRTELLHAWPGAHGVEMESGGVFPSVRECGPSGLPVFHLRVVTDLADPAKTDTAWRKIGAKTLANLIRQIDWRAVLKWPPLS